jgi:hypothetical protein
MGPAIRLQRLFAGAAKKRGQGKSQVDAWAEILDIEDGDPLKRMDRVAIALIEMRGEIARVRILCEVNGLEKELWEAPLNRMERGVTILNLGQSLDSSFTDLADALTSLAWLAATENEIPKNDRLQELKMISDLEQRIRGGTLPDDLKFFLFTQIDIIRRAIRDYELRGATVIRDAIYQVDGAVRDNENMFRQHANSDELVSFAGLQNAVKRSADFAIKAEKVLTAVAKMYHLGTAAAHVIAGLLPPATPQ